MKNAHRLLARLVLCAERIVAIVLSLPRRIWKYCSTDYNGEYSKSNVQFSAFMFTVACLICTTFYLGIRLDTAMTPEQIAKKVEGDYCLTYYLPTLQSYTRPITHRDLRDIKEECEASIDAQLKMQAQKDTLSKIQ